MARWHLLSNLGWYLLATHGGAVKDKADGASNCLSRISPLSRLQLLTKVCALRVWESHAQQSKVHHIFVCLLVLGVFLFIFWLVFKKWRPWEQVGRIDLSRLHIFVYSFVKKLTCKCILADCTLPRPPPPPPSSQPHPQTHTFAFTRLPLILFFSTAEKHLRHLLPCGALISLQDKANRGGGLSRAEEQLFLGLWDKGDVGTKKVRRCTGDIRLSDLSQREGEVGEDQALVARGKLI